MIAVLGASGQLGSAFVRTLGSACLPVTRDELDLTDLDAIGPWMQSVKPEAVINCAAYTAVDAAETDVETARAVNALAVGALAESTAHHGAGLVTFSTDYVFDGEKETAYVESDGPHPLNVYGRTKLEGERLALRANPEILVIRTSWLLSGTHPNFASKMVELISKGPVRVVDDQRGCPTLVDDLVVATNSAIKTRTAGVLHLVNNGQTTWFGLAREIAEIAGLDPDAVSPCPSSEYPRPAKRPLNSVLESERLDELMISRLPHYRQSLETAIRQIWEGPHGITSL